MPGPAAPAIAAGVWGYRAYQAYRAYRVYQMAKRLEQAAKAVPKAAEDAGACHDCEDDKDKCPTLRKKPQYKANPAHDKRSPLYNPKKTPEPPNAESLFQRAVADPGGSGRQWYTLDGDTVYRFSETGDGTAHFSGKSGNPDQPLNPSNKVKKKLGLKGKWSG